MIGEVLNRELQVWRPSWTSDGAGGRTATWTQAGMVRAKVDQPSATERIVAAQAGTELTVPIYLLPEADVTRGDELRGDGQVFEVQHLVHPSEAVYRRADCHELQHEPEA